MQRKIKISIVTLLWIYIIYRAAFISITQDEAHSYLLVKTNNWKQAAGTANTHWLNTLFMKVLLWLPGKDDPWKLRMLSILAWVIYACSTIKLSSYFKNHWCGFLFFIASVSNPFLLFYFSLARGYAPACAFIMLALWQATRLVHLKTLHPKAWFFVFLYASIATVSSFAAFYFFMALTGAYLLLLLQNRKAILLLSRLSRRWQLLVAGTTCFSIGSLWVMRHYNTLYYGGNSNVINSLFGSSVKVWSYFDDASGPYQQKGVSYFLSESIPLIYVIVGWLLFILVCIAAACVSYQYLVFKTIPACAFAIICCLIIVLLNVFLHLCFGTPYLFERTALILYPPLVLGLLAMLDETTHYKNVRLFMSYVSVIAVCFFVSNFLKGFSANYFKDWPVQTDTKKCLDYLEAHQAMNVGMNVWHRDIHVNYYRMAHPGNYHFKFETLPETLVRNSAQAKQLHNYDYLLIAPPYYDSLILKDWSLELHFPHSGSNVYKRITGQ